MLLWWFCREVEQKILMVSAPNTSGFHINEMSWKQLFLIHQQKFPCLSVSAFPWSVQPHGELAVCQGLGCAASMPHTMERVSEEKLSAFLFVPQQQRNEKNPKTAVKRQILNFTQYTINIGRPNSLWNKIRRNWIIFCLYVAPHNWNRQRSRCTTWILNNCV